MEELIRHLIQEGVLRSKAIVEAFRGVDRADFVLSGDRGDAYLDVPLAIGFGQTISQPTTVAIMLELLATQAGDRVLDVGSGSGWTTALLASLVGEHGEVTGVEIVPELVAIGQEHLRKYNFPWARIVGAQRSGLGLPNRAPFDRILVSAAAPSVPEELLRQLKRGGTMVIPVRDAVWRIQKSTDEEKKLAITKYEGFWFVPLVERRPGEKSK